MLHQHQSSENPHRPQLEPTARACTLDLANARFFESPPSPTHSEPEDIPSASCPAHFLAEPESSVHVSNSTPYTNFYVNGVGATCPGLSRSVKGMANLSGGTVYGVLNDTAELPVASTLLAPLGAIFPTFAKGIKRTLQVAEGVTKGFFGMLSSSMGRHLEKDAVTAIMSAVREKALRGEKIRLFCHSQGSIVTSNALEELRKELSPEQWSLVEKNVEVISFGARNYQWPDAIRVTLNVHRGDFPAFAMGLVSSIMRPFRRRSSEMRVVNRWGISHALGQYLEHHHEFEVLPPSRLAGTPNGENAASKVYNSIRDGRLADSTHIKMIDAAIDLYGKKFSAEFLRFAPKGEIGRFHVVPEQLERLRLSAG
ncbi:MAG: hypothetical protein KDD64_02010 [Bdellovibrionales bacterium]|nr:hypothetical protein [Bdellovibrionales bacterium]